MPSIATNLWFDAQAEEAAQFYVSIFKGSKMGTVTRYASETPSDKPVGSVMTVTFELDGRPFIALNGGPLFTFNESISFVVTCQDQTEIDYYWEKLSAVPESEQCGWLKDKFGVSWQVVPDHMEQYLQSDDPAKAKRAMEAMLQMKKIDTAALKQAIA